MKVKKTEARRLLPGNKFALLKKDNEKNGEESLWRQLRIGKAVEIDAKALLKENDLEVPSGHSMKTFVEAELGVEITKCSKDEEKIVAPYKYVGYREDKSKESYNEEQQDEDDENPGGEK